MRIGIIGPIASGKSTLAKKLSQHYNMKIIEEQVESNSYLPFFYEHKKKFALLSQNAFYSSLYLSMFLENETSDIICDTTLYSNLVFTELMWQEKILSDEDLNAVKTIAALHQKNIKPLDVLIIIKRPKEKLFENVLKRDRSFEKNQDDYLNFHYDHYYEKLETILFNFSQKEHIITLDDVDILDTNSFLELIKKIDSLEKS
jgi:deoxyguanosine kinase